MNDYKRCRGLHLAMSVTCTKLPKLKPESENVQHLKKMHAISLPIWPCIPDGFATLCKVESHSRAISEWTLQLHSTNCFPFWISNGTLPTPGADLSHNKTASLTSNVIHKVLSVLSEVTMLLHEGKAIHTYTLSITLSCKKTSNRNDWKCDWSCLQSVLDIVLTVIVDL